jgi:hypothetical protein
LKIFSEILGPAHYIRKTCFFQELNMKRKDYRRFFREGGRTFTLHFAAPLSTYAEQAAAVEARTYKEVFRRALEEYLRNHHPGLLQLGEEVRDA